MAIDFKQNAFVGAGFERLDDLVVNVLKRGPNGAGYEYGVRFGEGFGVTEDTISAEEADRIRSLVDGTKPALQAVVEIASVVQGVRLRALREPGSDGRVS